MNMSTNRNLDGELLSLDQMCEILNLGRTTTCTMAKEARAVRKIGRSFRIKKSVLLDYIEQNYKN